MYYAPMSFPVLVFLVVSLICYMHKHRNKKVNLSSSFPKSVPKAIPSRIKAVVDAHSDCTAEVFDVCSFTLNTNPVTMRHIPGDPVQLKILDGDVAVYIDDTFINKLYPPKGSHLKEVVESGHKFQAYIAGRDMAASNPNWMDFLSIVVFYKLDGIPPTKVNLNF